MTCHSVSMSRTSSTSPIQREVTQANGQRGSNQKSALFFAAAVTVSSRSGRLTALGHVRNHGGFGPPQDHVLGDDHAGNVLAAGKIEHHGKQDLLQDSAEAAGTGAPF